MYTTRYFIENEVNFIYIIIGMIYKADQII